MKFDFNDLPISSKKNDLFGRDRLAKKISKLFLNTDQNRNIVFAINGDWGSGKSSVVNLVEESLEAAPQKTKPTIVRFNPMFFSGSSDQLNKFFLREVVKEINEKAINSADKRAAKKIESYLMAIEPNSKKTFDINAFQKILYVLLYFGVTGSNVVNIFSKPEENIPLFIGLIVITLWLLSGLVPYFIRFLKHTSRSLSRRFSFFKRIVDFFQKDALKTLAKIESEIGLEFKKRDAKVLVIIDNVDGLSSSMLRAVFDLIKNNSNNLNISFLLAFDRNLVENDIQKAISHPAKDYLDKAIEVSFNLPNLDLSKVWELTFTALEDILQNFDHPGGKEGEKYYLRKVFETGIKNFIKNPRMAKKFLLNVSIAARSTSKSNFVAGDFAGIEALRVFAPSCYFFIEVNKKLFVSESVSSQEKNNERLKKVLEKKGEDSKKARNLYECIFFEENPSRDPKCSWVRFSESFDDYFFWEHDEILEKKEEEKKKDS